MKRALLFLLIFTPVFVPFSAAFAQAQAPATIPIVEVIVAEKEEADALMTQGLDVLQVTESEDGTVFTIMLNAFERNYLETNQIAYEVVVEDATAQVDWAGYKPAIMARSAAPIPGIPGTGATPGLTVDPDAVFDPAGKSFDPAYGYPQRLGYRTVTEYYAEMNYLAQTYPELVKLHEVGTSHEGYPILALEISNKPGAEDGRPSTLHQAGNHAREWPSNEMSLNLAWYLVTQYGNNPEVTNLVDTTKAWFMPMTNPDGVHYDQLTNAGTWRKNRRPNPDGSFGVDLNRNWSYRWGSDTGSSSNYSSGTYRGVAPNSEPESQAIINVYKNNQVLSSISGHTHGQLIIYAWAYEYNPENAHPLLADLAREQADINLYADQNGNVMYAQSGEINDYLWGAQRALGYTYEYGRSFVPPYLGTDMYKAVAPYDDYYGNPRRIPLTYASHPALTGAHAPAEDLTAEAVFMTEPFIIGYGDTDRYATVEKVQALGNITGKILMTHQARNATELANVLKAAQEQGAAGAIIVGNTATGATGGGYGHYTPNFGRDELAQSITIPVAGTSKPHLREFHEHVQSGGENTITLTSYTENTESIDELFARNVGAFMLNMSYATEYAAHITGQITDSQGNLLETSALDLTIDLESIILNRDGSERPRGEFIETSHSRYDVEGGVYDWSVLPSKQPEFENAGYDITASASGMYHQTKNVKVDWYQDRVEGVNYALADAIRSDFDFNRVRSSHKDLAIPFSTFVPDENGITSTKGDVAGVTATVNGEPVRVESLGNGDYIAHVNPNADLGLQEGDEAILVIDFAEGAPHSAFEKTIKIGRADMTSIYTYDHGGGRFRRGAQTVRKAEEGETITLATRSELGLARPGHTFLGWRVKGTTEILQPGSEFVLERNTEFEAVWQKI